jgi:hypothetical protein
MTRTLYLVRHGEHLDAEHGVPDGGLSKRGVRQSHAIAKRLKNIEFETNYDPGCVMKLELTEQPVISGSFRQKSLPVSGSLSIIAYRYPVR